MIDTESLYSFLKPEIEAVSDPLFNFSEMCIKKRGSFLPHAAVLTVDGEVRLIAAAPEKFDGKTNTTELLIFLQQSLREDANKSNIKAIGVAESVTITPDGQKPTKAIKVLFEHVKGLTVALYLPFEKKLFKGYVFGDMLSMSAKPEVNAWSNHVG